MKLREEQERKEKEALAAKEEAERRAAAALEEETTASEKMLREEAERKRKEEAERKIREELEMKLIEEQERKAREALAAKEEAERRAVAAEEALKALEKMLEEERSRKLVEETLVSSMETSVEARGSSTENGNENSSAELGSAAGHEVPSEHVEEVEPPHVTHQVDTEVERVDGERGDIAGNSVDGHTSTAMEIQVEVAVEGNSNKIEHTNSKEGSHESTEVKRSEKPVQGDDNDTKKSVVEVSDSSAVSSDENRASAGPSGPPISHDKQESFNAEMTVEATDADEESDTGDDLAVNRMDLYVVVGLLATILTLYSCVVLSKPRHVKPVAEHATRHTNDPKSVKRMMEVTIRPGSPMHEKLDE